MFNHFIISSLKSNWWFAGNRKGLRKLIASSILSLTYVVVSIYSLTTNLFQLSDSHLASNPLTSSYLSEQLSDNRNNNVIITSSNLKQMHKVNQMPRAHHMLTSSGDRLMTSSQGHLVPVSSNDVATAVTPMYNNHHQRPISGYSNPPCSQQSSPPVCTK